MLDEIIRQLTPARELDSSHRLTDALELYPALLQNFAKISAGKNQHGMTILNYFGICDRPAQEDAVKFLRARLAAKRRPKLEEIGVSSPGIP